VERVNDVEEFLRKLEHPVGLPMSDYVTGGEVTAADVEADGRAFLAFAQAFGVPVPTAIGPQENDPEVADDIRSTASR